MASLKKPKILKSKLLSNLIRSKKFVNHQNFTINRKKLFVYRIDIKKKYYNISFDIHIKKKEIYVHNFNCINKSFDKSFSDITKEISNIISFAKENDIKKITTNTWIFAKHPGIGRKLGFIPRDPKQVLNFIEFLKKHKIDIIVKEDTVHNICQVISDEIQFVAVYKIDYFTKGDHTLKSITLPKNNFPGYIINI